MNRSEGQRHRFATELLRSLGRDVLVPWPVLTEVDLLLRSRGHSNASTQFARVLRSGIHQLVGPTGPELDMALDLAERYEDSGVDLPDLIVMSMSSTRDAQILTWDYRHFRSVVLHSNHHWPLLVEASELPDP